MPTHIYMQTSGDGLILHLTEHHGDCCPGSTVFVGMNGIDEFHRKITRHPYPDLHPGIETTCYDARCLEVIDLLGDRIRFHEKLQLQKQSQESPNES